MKKDIFVIYLQFGTKLDEEFLYLSQIFSSFNMTLVPVEIEEFKKMRHTEKEFVFALVRNLDSLMSYKKLIKRYLAYPIRTGRISVYEASSFPIYHDSKILKDRCIVQERLPINIIHIASAISDLIHHKVNVDSKAWPGGKRAKLPA